MESTREATQSLRGWELLVASALLSTAWWLALVEDDNTAPGLLWAMLITAAALGALVSTDADVWLVGAGLGGPPLLLFPWILERPFEDPLWLMGVLMLAVSIPALAWIALAARRIAQRLPPGTFDLISGTRWARAAVVAAGVVALVWLSVHLISL